MVRRHALFALLMALGYSCKAAERHGEASQQVAQTQSQKPPQQQPEPQPQMAKTGDGGASNPDSSAAAPRESARSTKPDAAAPQEPAHSAPPDAALPDREQSHPAPAGMQDAAVRAPNAAAPAPTMPAADAACTPRHVDGPSGVFFHHVHFNTTDPSADLAFYEKFLDATTIDFCTRPDGGPATKASQTERAYLLFTRVATPPDPTLNAYLEHVGWCHPDPASELQRLSMLGAPLWPSDPGRGQCETAAAGTRPCNDYWFYLQSPSGAKVEIALGPGPATMGFGHVHVIMGEDLSWYQKLTDGRYADTAIDMVNITDVLEDEDYLSGEKVTDTRGKPIDHIAFSTSHLSAERDRIEAAGIEIAEDISFKPEFGFKSFFVKSAKGIWVEMVEDSAFAP